MLAKMTVFSHVLDKSCDITVVGPKKLEDTRPMKVTYLLHGLTGNDANWVQYTQLPLWAREGNTLFILPDAGRSWYTDAEYGQRYFTYIARELPNTCRGLFNISGRREDTAVMGNSMGGYKKCVSVMSDGGLTHFVHANKPEGAPTHCLDGCPHEKSCPYFAPKLYLTQITDVSWPTTAVTTDTSFAGRYAALQTGQYGRCVYQCDNDVADHQSAVFTMEDGSTASFNLIALSSETTRILRIYGTKGDIQGHLDRNQILLSDFNSKKIIDVKYDTVSSLVSGHGGGDARLVEDFIDAVKGDTRSMKTSGRLSLQSHRMAFAAEKSRKTGQRISL